MQRSFREQFEPYTLSGVQVTDRELGRGSYAAVVEIEYRGLKCAGKKIHQAIGIAQQGHEAYQLRRFAEECRLLSQMRHPNVVQFLGVHFERCAAIPILVMEFLPTNVSSCIDQYGILAKEINYSILHDVSLGLCYLHNQTPPIIHRDLSANNVLLASNMTAKISDLGVARILNLTPLQMSRMTEAPGTPTYMPPEVMVADPKYNTSVDIFSYGVLMIHVFSGQWPHPKTGPTHTEASGRLVPVSEAERREEYLRTIGQDHPLMDLILKCLNNHPPQRGNVSEIVQRLKDAVVRFPPSFANKVEMLSRIAALEEEKNGLVADSEQKDEEIEQGKKKVEDVERENANLKEQHQTTVERLQLAHSSEVKQLQSKVRDVNAQVEMITSEKQAIEIEKETIVEDLTQKKKTAELEKLKLKKSIKLLRETNESEKQAHRQAVENYEKIQKTLRDDIDRLEGELEDTKCSNTQLAGSLSRKDSEIASKKTALTQKDDMIKSLSDQLTRTREYLTCKRSAEAELEPTQVEMKTMAALICKEQVQTTKIVEIEAYNDRKFVESHEHIQDAQTNNLQKLQSQIASKRTEARDLTQKDHGLNYLHTRTREYLSSKQWAITLKMIAVYVPVVCIVSVICILQPGLPKITWGQCADLPMAAAAGQTTVINNRVYYGGFATDRDGDQRTVYCYDPSQDTWSPLPPLPVRYFGLGQVRGQLVSVGGMRISDGEVSNELYVFDERSKKWNQSFPPMPTARLGPAVISHPSALIVAGGYTDADYTDVVEIFNTETSKWLRADRLPTPCLVMSPVIVKNMYYLVGGINRPSKLNQSLCVSVDKLLHNATPLNQAPPHDTADTQDRVSVWKQLADTPTYWPTVAVMMGETVLSIGGEDAPEDGKAQSSVHMYSPSTNSWIYISDLPAPRFMPATTVLSPTEILVIGGQEDGNRNNNTVYKGTLV